MDISFLNFNPSSQSGPNSFGTRLANEMQKKHHNVLLTQSKNNLIFIETQEILPQESNNILRLDGIWTRKDQIELHNKHIKKLYKECNAVIWQSEYDKRLTTSLWGEPNAGFVIYNGIEYNLVEVCQEIQNFRNNNEQIFICSANWHRQKRLKEIIDFFYINRSSKSKLIILGTNFDISINDPDIIYMGHVSHNICLQLYRISDWMIHLAWRDHCPNVVIEALSQQCSVICTNSGGTKELVKHNGIILDDKNNRNIDSLMFDYDLPPHLDIEKINLTKPAFDENIFPSIQKSYASYNQVFEKHFK